MFGFSAFGFSVFGFSAFGFSVFGGISPQNLSGVEAQ